MRLDFPEDSQIYSARPSNFAHRLVEKSDGDLRFKLDTPGSV
jgi:hypothetical protein